MAAETAGINVNAMKYQAIAISGLIGGLAGASSVPWIQPAFYRRV